MLRRLEKRIIVDLPTFEARKKMLQHHLPPTVIKENGLLLQSELDYNRLAELTDGYSGSDLKLVCKEAAMKSVRKVFAVLESLNEGKKDFLSHQYDDRHRLERASYHVHTLFSRFI
jgi:katanin p60 ATPase-containing subunit A1